MIEQYINELIKVFEENSNALIGKQQEDYLKGKFKCLGIKAPVRREISKVFLSKDNLPSKEEAFLIVQQLWNNGYREYHQFAVDLLLKYTKNLEKDDIQLYEFLILNQSWWDTVDVIADKLVGSYFKKFPELRYQHIDNWLSSNNIWLQRTTLIFQLKYKDQLDTEILSDCIQQLLGSKVFFVNKAIGWILRQYSRTNPEWVIDFVEQTPLLAPLSKKEALRLIPYSI